MAAPIPLHIDQWYDRHERIWITAIKRTDTGEQIGDALLDGNRKDAAASKGYLHRQIKNGTIRAEYGI